MPAFLLTGGPCHWDLHVQLYVAIGPNLATNVGIMDADLRIRDKDLLAKLTRDRMSDMTDGFNKVFNPNLDEGEWTLYEFPPCCSFHISLSLRPLPIDWSGKKSEEELRSLLPHGWGVAQVERLDGRNSHAQIGGILAVLETGDLGSHLVAHEVGHLLGLPDRYRHPHNHDEVSEEIHRENRGRLMGDPQYGRRTLDETEVAEIAAATGMSCDAQHCCRGNENGDEGSTATQERHKAHPDGGVLDVPEKTEKLHRG